MSLLDSLKNPSFEPRHVFNTKVQVLSTVESVEDSVVVRKSDNHVVDYADLNHQFDYRDFNVQNLASVGNPNLFKPVVLAAGGLAQADSMVDSLSSLNTEK